MERKDRHACRHQVYCHQIGLDNIHFDGLDRFGVVGHCLLTIAIQS
jgi:hypothetical protein